GRGLFLLKLHEAAGYFLVPFAFLLQLQSEAFLQSPQAPFLEHSLQPQPAALLHLLQSAAFLPFKSHVFPLLHLSQLPSISGQSSMQQQADFGRFAAVLSASILTLIASISALIAAILALSGVSFRFSLPMGKPERDS